MFNPRKLLRVKPQKSRCSRYRGTRLLARLFFRHTWAGVRALGIGYLAASMPERLYIWAKRVAQFPKHTSKFWVNIGTGVVVTRKPANVRMGKGKGSRVGLQAKVWPGLWLLAFSVVRLGRLRQLRRHVQVRCNFKVIAHIPQLFKPALPFSGSAGILPYWRTWQRMQLSFVPAYQVELREQLALARQPAPIEFVRRLFKWYRKRPRAGWRAPWGRTIRFRRWASRAVRLLAAYAHPGLARRVSHAARRRGFSATLAYAKLNTKWAFSDVAVLDLFTKAELTQLRKWNALTPLWVAEQLNFLPRYLSILGHTVGGVTLCNKAHLGLAWASRFLVGPGVDSFEVGFSPSTPLL